jgi:hypothetical protein
MIHEYYQDKKLKILLTNEPREAREGIAWPIRMDLVEALDILHKAGYHQQFVTYTLLRCQIGVWRLAFESWPGYRIWQEFRRKSQSLISFGSLMVSAAGILRTLLLPSRASIIGRVYFHGGLDNVPRYHVP